MGGTRVVVEDSGERVEIEANVILIQALNHGTDHRSQVCTILGVLGVLGGPGRLPGTGDGGQTIVDAWSWSDALGLARRLP